MLLELLFEIGLAMDSWDIIELLSMHIERSNLIVPVWITALASSVIGAGIGAFLGYWLASRREEQKDRIRYIIKLNDDIIGIQLEVIPHFNFLTMVVRARVNPTSSLWAIHTPRYVKTSKAVVEASNRIVLLYLETKTFLPECSSSAARFYRAWSEMNHQLPDVNEIHGLSNQDVERIELSFDRCKDAFKVLAKDLYTVGFPHE